ncbi:MAG: UDP-N-acetylmuramoyl-L-alanyl-D-glutamate--2,6-diaminopimelate ligase [Acidobacteriota bacterium]
MKLIELAKQINAIAATGNLEAEATNVTRDSRACTTGTVFVAIRGEKIDAHNFIPQVVEQGAVAVISEQPADANAIAPAWIQVANARVALAAAAAAVYDFPSQKIKVVGITGTNGKTTTAHLVDSIIRAAEITSAMFGTIKHRIGDYSETAKHTTPEAADIQRMLAQAVDANCQSAVMEISSHAIELHRADHLQLAAAVFTNLTRDHLDYHKTMESYFAAKEKLFNGALGLTPRASVINIDDEYGRKLLHTAKGKIITYGFSENADVRTDEFNLSANGLSFIVTTPTGQINIESTLVGRPHVYNILASIATGMALGFDLRAIAAGIVNCQTVAGRFEQVGLEETTQLGFAVIVDYAHTDDALKNVLQTAREVVGNRGRVITVFGCGGDRDKTKRPIMGEVAARLSDVVIVTSDNPRSEDPLAIIADIEVGLEKAGKPYEKLADRRKAIFAAVNEARDGDLVVIAGKGHEDYQILKDQTIHFSDLEVARQALQQRLKN